MLDVLTVTATRFGFRMDAERHRSTDYSRHFLHLLITNSPDVTLASYKDHLHKRVSTSARGQALESTPLAYSANQTYLSHDRPVKNLVHDRTTTQPILACIMQAQVRCGQSKFVTQTKVQATCPTSLSTSWYLFATVSGTLEGVPMEPEAYRGRFDADMDLNV